MGWGIGRAAALCALTLVAWAPSAVAQPCDEVTATGCCDGETLKYCGSDSELVEVNCAAFGMESCGWLFGQYSCNSDGSENASFPKACPGAPSPCQPDCNGKICGDDGCGGSCGDCATGLQCDSVSGTCFDPGGNKCDAVQGFTGCCVGSVWKRCNGLGEIQVIDCDHARLDCGWSEFDTTYSCYTEGSVPLEDPTGTWPALCPTIDPPGCTPDCTGKACGDDGCGGSCGTCTGNDTCDAGGQCVCTPDCAGKVCGDDGCGGSCGTCAGNDTCDAGGQCVCTPDCFNKICGDDGCGGSCGECGAGFVCGVDGFTCEPSADPCYGLPPFTGCCDGNTLNFCNIDSEPVVVDCTESGLVCAWDEPNSGYSCLTFDTGSDPSGTYPKACPGACAPDCQGKDCGDDGCGGSCGSCPGNGFCDDMSGQCICTPDCAGKVCGDDGCGGSCGSCGGGEICDVGGQCVCAPDCAAKVCGGDGCGGSCGTCAAGETCSPDGSACEPDNDPCFGLPPFTGCCDGNVLNFCNLNGDPVVADCAANGLVCAWSNPNDSYSCLTVDTGADPSGTWPKACPGACAPDCTGKDCGDDGCGGSCGDCEGNFVCNAGTGVCECTPDCDGKACGDDGCGGSCGSCPEGEVCSVDFQCGADPCFGLPPFVGCCDGQTLNFCNLAGTPVQSDCSDFGLFCGWDSFNGVYSCGTFDSGEDPSGQWDKACPGACEGDCQGRVCGDDGCGGSCGACPGGLTCNASGQCVCAPDCAGKNCGDDGCGGVCGTCPAGSVCGVGGQCQCVPDCEGKTCGDDGCGGSCGTCPALYVCGDAQTCEEDPCQGLPPLVGCCDGETLSYCTAASEKMEIDCSVDGNLCTWDFINEGYGCLPMDAGADPSGTYPKACPGGCAANCVNKECGDDGCGGLCGTCEASETCDASTRTCVPKCIPECGGKVCGPDGCGGTCGVCAGNNICDLLSGTCGCPKFCDGKVCGPDGCGGVCGTCGPGTQCNAAGSACECAPDCAGKDCGPDGCGGFCGFCGAGGSCDTSTGQCQCIPDCDGAHCGDDGCGGVCQCALGNTCDLDTGMCSPSPGACAAQGIPAQGCCDDEGDTLVLCYGSGIPYPASCAAYGETCGWNASAGTYNCGYSGAEPTGAIPKDCPCVPDCSGKACGADGCGGTCGECGGGEVCDLDGQCVTGCAPGISDLGCCDGDVARYCSGSGKLIVRDCGVMGLSCGWNKKYLGEDDEFPKAYRCGDNDEDEPTGAVDGMCPACVPDCEGRICGGDGCGGSCGECPEGQQCTPGGTICLDDDGCDSGVTGFGCCDGNLLRKCDNGKETFQDCGADGCGYAGWAGWTITYQCGYAGYLEPSLTLPYACPDASCTPDCTDRECGTDGCGGSCGSCQFGQSCDDGVCKTDPCAATPAKGCCEGDTIRLCNDKGEFVTGDCSQYNMACGWNPNLEKYQCINPQLYPGGADPDGNHPLACPAICIPNCDGKQCGDDGCGGSCGTCDEKLCSNGTLCKWQCNAAGICEAPCIPNCSGKQCGPDGCGGQCGECADNQECYETSYGDKFCTQKDLCAGVPGPPGCCDGTVIKKCIGLVQVTTDCAQYGKVCAWTDDPKYGAGASFKCVDKKDFGVDASGQHPWACPGAPACQPDCAGKACGPDGCGGQCGTCTGEEVCNPETQQCVACDGVPYEGCCKGGLLKRCTGEGGSDNIVYIHCDNTDYPGCGWSASSDVYVCGEAGTSDPSGNFPKNCPCEPQCDGKQCGSDGCYGTCGTCPGGTQCYAPTGKCYSDATPCGSVGWEGECDGETLRYCANGNLVEEDCAALGKLHCGWDKKGQVYACATGGQPEPTGTLPKSGEGSTQVCVPDCEDKQCGPDGCGNQCGSCIKGAVCADGSHPSYPAGTCAPPVQASNSGIPEAGCCKGDQAYETYDWGGYKGYPTDCASFGATCGWNSGTGKYACSNTGDADPSGTHPKACPVPEPACQPGDPPCSYDGFGLPCGGGCTIGWACDFSSTSGYCQISNTSCYGGYYPDPSNAFNYDDDKCGDFVSGWQCQCDTGCLDRGDCCDDFSAACGQQLYGATCGDGQCESSGGETCQTCSGDCGSCSGSGSLSPPWNAPYAQVQVAAGTAHSYAAYAIDPLDQVLPGGAPYAREGLLAYVPDYFVNNLAALSTWAGQSQIDGSGSVGLVGGAKQGQGMAFSGGDDGGIYRIVPDPPLPATQSYIDKSPGGFTIAFWTVLFPSSEDVAQPLMSTKGVDLFEDEACGWSRPGDSAAWLACDDPAKVITNVRTYYGAFDTELYTANGACSDIETIGPNYQCYADVQKLVEDACLGKQHCHPNPWDAYKDPCGEPPNYVPNNSKLIVKYTCDYASNASSAYGGRLFVTDSTEGNLLRWTVPGQENKALSTKGGIKDGKWHHVAVSFNPFPNQVRDGVTALYLDGVLQDSSDLLRAPNIRDIIFGAMHADASSTSPNKVGEWLTSEAWVDEIFVYDRALPEVELRALYHKPATGVTSVWPPIPAEEIVDKGLYMEDGVATLVDVEADWLLDVGATQAAGSNVALKSPRKALSIPEGANLRIPLHNAQGIIGSSNFTLAAWVRIKDFKPGKKILQIVNEDTTKVAIDLNAGLRLRAYTNPSAPVKAGDSEFSDALTDEHEIHPGEWVFVTYVFRGKGFYQDLFLDGYRVGRSAGGSSTWWNTFTPGKWAFKVSGGVDILWAAVAPNTAMSPAKIARLQSLGPAVWLDGGTYKDEEDVVQLKDLANFHNFRYENLTEGPRDAPQLESLFGPGPTQEKAGPLNLRVDPANVRIPVKGKLRPTWGGELPPFTFSGRLRWQGSDNLNAQLIHLEYDPPDGDPYWSYYRYGLTSKLVCKSWEPALYQKKASCYVELKGFNAKGEFVRWQTEKREATAFFKGESWPSGAAVDVAIAYEGGTKPVVSFGVNAFYDWVPNPGGATVNKKVQTMPTKSVEVQEVETLTQSTHWNPRFKDHLFYIIGRFSASFGDVGIDWESIRVYPRKLSAVELERLVTHDCDALDCEASDKVCADATSGAALPVCASCDSASYEASSDLGGLCVAKREFMDVCSSDAACATGTCVFVNGATGLCLEVGATAPPLCVERCGALGRNCVQAGSSVGFTPTWMCSSECAKYYDPPSSGKTTDPCLWTPVSELDDVCDSDRQCKSGSCDTNKQWVYAGGLTMKPACKADGNCPQWTNNAGTAPLQCNPSNQPFTDGFYDGAACPPTFNFGKLYQDVSRCDAKTAEECKAQHREVHVEKHAGVDGADVYTCHECEKKTFKDASDGKDKPIWVKGWNLLAPSVCNKMMYNETMRVWEKKDPYWSYHLVNEPSIVLLKRYVMGKDGVVTPKDLADMEKMGVGPLLMQFIRADAKTKNELRAKYWRLNLRDCAAPTISKYFPPGGYAEWLGVTQAEDYAKYSELYSVTEPTRTSPYFDKDINFEGCVANKFGNGTKCPPDGAEGEYPDQFCESGFCARDTKVCETGFGRLETNEDASRSDDKNPDDSSDLAPIKIIQQNTTTLEVKKEKKQPAGQKVFKKGYSLSSRQSYSLQALGGSPSEVLSMGMAVKVKPNDKQGTYSSDLKVFGLTLPNSRQPAISCPSANWVDGKYQAPATNAPPCVTPTDLNKLKPDMPTLKLCIPAPGGCEENEEFTKLTGGKKKVGEGPLCLESTTFAGPIPITIQISVPIDMCVGVGADINSSTFEPGFKIVPELGVGLDLRGGVGVSKGPIEAFAGIRAVITILNLSFPVRWALRVAGAVDPKTQKTVDNLFVVRYFRTVAAELNILKLVVAIFAEVQALIVKVEWEQKLFEFGGLKFAWTLADDDISKTKVDLQHITADQDLGEGN